MNKSGNDGTVGAAAGSASPPLGRRQRETELRTYLARAREAQQSGDVVEMENCYQHAEHYFRVMRGQGHERRG